MTAAPKLSSPLKLPRGGNLVFRTAQNYGEAAVLWEETGMSTKGAPRGRGPGTYARIVEITSGRAISQQGLVTTCKDPTYKGRPRRWEGFGLAHEPIRAMTGE
jgi:hypothetical protein